jgi:hypothetical protein
LRATLRETSASLKTRDDELADCKTLIRLLSDQLEHAHKRIAVLADAPRNVQTIESPSTQSCKESNTKTLALQNSEFVIPSPAPSPRSLVSLESSIGRHSEDETTERNIAPYQLPIEMKQSVDSVTEIYIPLQLEHVPKTIRRRSMLDPPTHPIRTPFFRKQPQIPTKRNSKPITPAPSRINIDTPKSQLPPTPEDSPIPVKLPAQRGPITLRGRMFRSKSDLQDSKSLVETQDPPPAATKSVVKKNSLIRFWRSNSSKPKDETNKKPTAKEVFNLPSSPESSPIRNETTKNFTAPHESDKLSRYPKIKPVSIATTTVHTRRLSTPNPEWRHSIGRQVAEMVQHWEDETNKRNDKLVTCANYVASKRTSSFKDGSPSPLAVRAVKDGWTAKCSGSTTTLSRTPSLRGGERINNFRRQREDLVKKKMGLNNVSPNPVAAG